MHRLPLLILLTTSVAAAQDPSPGAISGIVFQIGSPDARIPGAKVEIRYEGTSAPIHTTTTDNEGRFFFPRLQPTQYRIAASAGGFVRSEMGQKKTNGPGLPITLAANQKITDVSIAMTPTGAVSGRITDANGEPIVLADVFALKSSYQEGQRMFTQVLSAKTDDRGEYRIFWLTPGLYYINVIIPDGTQVSNLIINAEGQDSQASMHANRNGIREVLSRPIGTGAGPNEAHVPVYFPTTTDPRGARAIEVGPGSDIRGINITALRVTTRTIRGVVTNGVTRQPPGANSQAQMVLAPMNPAQRPTEGKVDLVTGNFEIPRVVPGNYVLYTRIRNVGSNTPAGPATPFDFFWGSQPLEVRDRDLEGISLAAGPGIPLPGRITIEETAATPPTSAAGLFIGMRPDPLVTQTVPSPSTTVSGDGSFTLPPILAGQYRVYVIPMLAPNNPQLISGLPPMPPGLAGKNAYVKSIRLGGTDVLNTGVHLSTPGQSIEIVLGTNPGAVEGRVVDSQKQAVDGAIVGLVPYAASARGFRTDMYKTASTDSTGRFQIYGIPPGDYKVFAWDDIDKSTLIDQDLMQVYEDRGLPLRIEEGMRPTVELLVIPARQIP
jgi:hypothetical protein